MFRRTSTVLLGAVFWIGCVDPPIVTLVSAPDAGSAVADGGSAPDGHGAGGFELSVCKDCLMAPEKPGPGCGSAYAACVANPVCDRLIACALGNCVGGPSSAFIGCAIPCAQDAGVLSGNDPSLPLASAVYNCFINGACTAGCFTQ